MAMFRRCTILIAFCAALLAVQPLLADDGRDDRRDDGRDDGRHDDATHDWAPEFENLGGREYSIIALSRAVEIVTARFEGRVIAARLTGPAPHERARGVVLVHELRLLTPGRDVLRIRLDARNGDFLEVAGAGLTKARRKGADR